MNCRDFLAGVGILLFQDLCIVPMMMLVPLLIIFKIKHKDPGFSQSVIVTRGGGDQTFEEKYTTDGKESDVKISSGTVKATAKWEGDTLTIEHKSETGAILNRRKYTLSADGKTLTLTVRYFTTNGEIDETTLLEKATVVTKPYLIR